jgi:hypothetical protein
MTPDLLSHILAHPHGAAGAFRSFVGYPLFGSAFQTLWPLFLIPLLAALLGERAAAALPRTPRAWIPAALLAAVPGLLALGELWLVLTPTILGPIVDWHGWLLMWIAPGVGLALMAYALVRAFLCGVDMRRLRAASSRPSPRLRRAAAELGIRARELNTGERECFVSDVLRPTVYISRGALARLGETELLAALHHERAHIQGRDTLVLFLLSLLADLAPFAPRGGIEVYQAAREAAADAAAVAGAGKLDLASALWPLPPPTQPPTAPLPMAKPETLRWRLQAILQDGEAPPASWQQASVGLVAVTLLLAWPLLQLQLHDIFCWH